MAESVYQRMSEQHIRRLRQLDSPQPVDLVRQQQSQIPGDHNPWRAEAALEAHLQRHSTQRQAGEQLQPQQQHLHQEAVSQVQYNQTSQNYKGN